MMDQTYYTYTTVSGAEGRVTYHIDISDVVSHLQQLSWFGLRTTAVRLAQYVADHHGRPVLDELLRRGGAEQ